MTGPASGCARCVMRACPSRRSAHSNANWWQKSNMRSSTNRNYDWSRWPMGRATTGSSSPRNCPQARKWGFYHAAEHLRRAFGHVYGETSPKAQASFMEYRHLLLKAEDGVGRVIRTLAYHQASRKRRCKALKQELAYFRAADRRTHGLCATACRESADRLGRGGGGLQDAGDPAHETLRATLEHRRRAGDPHLPCAGAKRALRCRVARSRLNTGARFTSPKTSCRFRLAGHQYESYTQSIEPESRDQRHLASAVPDVSPSGSSNS